MNLMKYVKKKKTEKKRVMIFCLFAGHGMIDMSEQVLLCNEFNKKMNFYTFFKAENLLRDLVSKCDNVWVMALFACCRQKFLPDDVCLCFDEAKAVEVRDKLAQLAAYEHEVEKYDTSVDFDE